MATIWTHGVPWYDKALEAANHRGIAAEVSEVARAYRDDSGSVSAYPDISGDDRVRVQRGEVAAVLGRFGVVIGFASRSSAADAEKPVVPVRTRYKAPSGSGTHLRGPSTWDELKEWLREENYTLELAGSGHIGVYRELGDGGRLERIGTIASTASDHRTLANTVSDLRTAGATLRRASR